MDLNNDGKFNAKDGTTGVYFLLNNDGDVTYKIAVTAFNLHPDFTGFNHPAVNDDLAILTLAEDAPTTSPSTRWAPATCRPVRSSQWLVMDVRAMA